MKQFFYIIFLTILVLGCAGKAKNDQSVEQISETKLVSDKGEIKINFPIYDYEGLQPLLNKEDDKTYIVNFWATWCKPCVEEMPYFEKTFKEQQPNGVEMILVSLDMPSMWEKKLVPFVEKNDLKGQVVILDDPKMNDWIPRIDKDWQGGIPATLIYNREKRTFYPHGFTYEELNTELNKFIQQK